MAAKRQRGRPPIYDFSRVVKSGNGTWGPFDEERLIMNCQNAAWQYADRHGLTFDTRRSKRKGKLYLTVKLQRGA